MGEVNFGPCECCGQSSSSSGGGGDCDCIDYQSVNVLHLEDNLGNSGNLNRMTGPGSPPFGWEGTIGGCIYQLLCEGAGEFSLQNSTILCSGGDAAVTVESCVPLQISFTISGPGQCCSARSGTITE